jgi:hypothetical protein
LTAAGLDRSVRRGFGWWGVAMGGAETEDHPMSKRGSKSSTKPAPRNPGNTRPKKSGAARKPRASKGRAVAQALTKLGSPRDQRKPSKTEICLELLRRGGGVTIEELQDATSWQAHSVRGFLSGAIKKKLGHKLVSDKSKDGPRRYRISSDRG